MIEGLDHVGIAVRNLDATLTSILQVLGDKPVTREEVTTQKVRVAHIDLGNVKLELLESTAPDGPVGKFIERRGEGLHHLSFRVGDVERELDRLDGQGVQLVDRHARLGAEGNLVAFLHPRSTGGVLVELCQHPEEAVG